MRLVARPRLKLRSHQGNQAGREDSRGAKSELADTLLEPTDALFEPTDPLVQSCHVGPDLSPPRPHLRLGLGVLGPTLSALSAELLEDAVKRRVDDGHPIVMAFVGPPWHGPLYTAKSPPLGRSPPSKSRPLWPVRPG
jgi:hypothetical protein